MSLGVKERGNAVATHRYVCVRLMETLARWVPTTPEMEVKLLFGSHIWDAAQHADALGRRTHELRMPLQHSLEPVAGYRELLDQVDAIPETSGRISAFYDVLLPGIDARLRAYLDATDSLMDGPTVRIVDRILYDHARMIRESEALRAELPALQAQAGGLAELRRREAGLGYVDGGAGAQGAPA
jgi:hypothetical protein